MLNRNIETFIGCDNEYEESKIVIFGAPLTLQLLFVLVHASQVKQCVVNRLELRRIALIRIKT